MGIDYVVSILTDVIADIQSGGTSVMKFDLINTHYSPSS